MNSVGPMTGFLMLVFTTCLLGGGARGLSSPFLALSSFYWGSEIRMRDCWRQSSALTIGETGFKTIAGLSLWHNYCRSVTLHVSSFVLHECQCIPLTVVVRPSPRLKITLEFVFLSTVNIKLIGQDGFNCSGITKRTSLILAPCSSSVSRKPSRAVSLREVHAEWGDRPEKVAWVSACRRGPLRCQMDGGCPSRPWE